MKIKILSFALFLISSLVSAQYQGYFWKTTLKTKSAKLDNKQHLPEDKLYNLDLVAMATYLKNAPKRNFSGLKSNLIVFLPTSNGKMVRFGIFENSTMEPALQAKYPDINSYVGVGIDNPTLKVHFSMSPLGFKSMLTGAENQAEYIETVSSDAKTYSVYKEQDRKESSDKIECGVAHDIKQKIGDKLGFKFKKKASDCILRTYRLAVSTTGEYTAYFGGTKAGALAGINETMTNVNAIFERDFGVRMNLIPDTEKVIYTDGSTDPYSNDINDIDKNISKGNTTLRSKIGFWKYDIGHVFSATHFGGKVAMLGNVCEQNKGGGVTGISTPKGIIYEKYVAHEMGHQFGAEHTFSDDDQDAVGMEVYKGNTIMGYTQPRELYFHAASIQQVTGFVNKFKLFCGKKIATKNATPTTNAGLDYTIPKSTPFVLDGLGFDRDINDVLTYSWEQMNDGDNVQVNNKAYAYETKPSGPNFTFNPPTTSTKRYFPKMESILAGELTTLDSNSTVIEALSSVGRPLNFRLTVRDNKVGGGANKSDDMVVNVNANAGPFSVTSQNTTESYIGGSTQTVTWAVGGTTANGINCANVNILISTNGGTTWTTLLASTPNDGSQEITIPNFVGTTNRIMVKGTNHIFFDVNNTNFTITAGSADTIAPTAPTLVGSGTTETTTNLFWSGATDNVAVFGYEVYNGTTLVLSTSAENTTFTVTTLSPSTTYRFTVRAKDIEGNLSDNSNTVEVTTTNYCESYAKITVIERIGMVQFGSINNFTDKRTAGYEDFTSLSTTVARGSANGITIAPFRRLSLFSPHSYYVYIDYNQDGDFDDAGEFVYSKAQRLFTFRPVSGTITIPATATLGVTRMRVVLKAGYFAKSSSCGWFINGQVHDYSVNITAAGGVKIQKLIEEKVTKKEEAKEEVITNNGISFELYPNPVKGDVLNISNHEGKSNYRIFNLSGLELKQGKIENNAINVNYLSAGIYILEVSNKKGKFSKSFIKQ